MLNNVFVEDMLKEKYSVETGEKRRTCDKMNGNCDDCQYQDMCAEAELLNSLDEW